MQARYDQLLRANPDLTCAQCDRSIGRDGGLFLRRTRLVVSGDVTDRLSVYLQPDFASAVNDAEGILQLRDVYVDVALDARKEWRVRVGQRKIPFGWENMQSSSVRVSLDRTDAINSALINERDVAVIGYWAPERIRARLKQLVDSGLKGSGDYGVVGLGVFNGRGTNRSEANDGLHTVARAAYPFQLPGGQLDELDARRYRVREMAAGVEWTVTEAVELTAAYQLSDRTYEDLATRDNRQKGRLLRLQGQFGV